MAKNLFMVFLLLMTLVFTGTASAEADRSVRERLAAAKTVKTLYAIDAYHSLIVGETKFMTGDFTQEFANEVAAVCTESGGKIEIGRAKTDPITGKEELSWVPRDEAGVDSGRIDGTYLSNPVTGAGRIRCNGVFEVVDVFGETLRSAYSSRFVRKELILRHASPQPLVYKSEGVPSYEKVVTLPDGDITFSAGKKGGMFSLSAQTLGGADLFQYLQALCDKNKGKARYVANKGKFVKDPNRNTFMGGDRGRYVDELAEVDSLYAFKYVALRGLTFPSGLRRTWYFACEGDQRFVAKGDAEKNVFASNRGLDGVDFVQMEAQIVPASVQPEMKDSKGQKTLEEQIAVEVAIKKINLFKNVGNQEYTGIYNGQQDQCDLITVRKKWDTTLKTPRIDTFNYRICSGTIVKASETPVEQLPDGMDAFSLKLARVAQKTGSAEGEYQGYKVRAQALRDKDQCSIEVKVFKDINLLSSKVINGCQ